MEWHFSLQEVVAGAIGGLCYAIFRDEVTLPHKSGLKIYLGFFRAVVLGAFVAFLVNTHPVLSALMGFSFNDVIVSMQRKVKHWIERDTKKGGDNGVS